jgi:[ribosomal protein S5]-alanine N-acetyltransferase
MLKMGIVDITEQLKIYTLSDEYFLRSLVESDLDGPYPTWFEDQDVCCNNSHGNFFKTKDHFKAYFDALNFEDRIVFAMCHIDDGHVGNISLQAISFIDRSAEFAILIGDKRHWGKGLGLLAGKRLIAHGFNKLDLQRIHCGTAASNHGMIKLATTLGMEHEGTRREHLYLNGNRVDLLEYGLLRSEFNCD